MKRLGARLRFSKCLAVGVLGIGIMLSSSMCQAYFNGAPAYNSNYRPINAHMGVEAYVDLSSTHIVTDNERWLVFNVLTVSADEDSDEVRANNTPIKFKVNKQTREAWIFSKQEWNYLELNRSPFGYETSSFTTVNMVYRDLYGEFLNDSSGTAAAYDKYYKGE